MSLAGSLLDEGAPLVVSTLMGGHQEGYTGVSALQCAVANGLLPLVEYLCELSEQLIAGNNSDPPKRENNEDEDEDEGEGEDDEDDDDEEAADQIAIFSPNWRDITGYNAMHYVAFCPDYKIATALIRRLQAMGLRVDVRGGMFLDPHIPFSVACRIGNYAAALALLRSG